MKCPFCSQEHPDKAQFCPVTGNSLQNFVKPNEELSTSRLCPNCSKDVPNNIQFCPFCGYQFPSELKLVFIAQPKIPLQRSKLFYPFLIALLVVGIGLILLGVFFLSGKSIDKLLKTNNGEQAILQVENTIDINQFLGKGAATSGTSSSNEENAQENNGQIFNNVYVPPEYAGKINPLGSDAAVEGKVIYIVQCKSCHGESGKSGGSADQAQPQPAANLVENVSQYADDFIYYRISEGGAMDPNNSSMPPFKDIFSEHEIWQLITYISTLKYTSNNTSSTATPTLTATPTSTITPTQTITLTPVLLAAEIKINEKDQAEIVLIPAGEFLMGSDEDTDPYFWGAEGPSHRVYLDGYWIYRNEVTNGMYQACVSAGSCPRPQSNESRTRESYYGNPEYENYPVMNITYMSALSYCRWTGGRLPTEAEWEKAARGDLDARLFPWGNSPAEGNQANFCDHGCPGKISDNDKYDGYRDTAPVGSYPDGMSLFGLYDTAGNVWEYVFDYFGPLYYEISPEKNPRGPQSSQYRVIRGGGWNNPSDGVRIVQRAGAEPDNFYDTIGFRCALDAGE